MTGIQDATITDGIYEGWPLWAAAAMAAGTPPEEVRRTLLERLDIERVAIDDEIKRVNALAHPFKDRR